MRHATTRRGHQRRHRVRPAWPRAAAALAAVAAVALVAWLAAPGDAGPEGGGPAAARPAASSTPAAPATAPAPAVSSATATAASAAARPPTPGRRATPAEQAAPQKTAAPPRKQSAPGGQRSIVIVNHTSQTVWAVATGTAAYPKGRRLAPGASTSLLVGTSWGGRIWGRTGCTGDASGHCLTGDCTTTCGGPVTPTTLGEFTFDAFDGMDFYDVSMVDGSNLPMYINISHTASTDPLTPTGCYRGACTHPVACPAAMRATAAGGQVIGCKPPCAAFGGDTYCCRGAWSGRENCLPAKWPVDYTQVFKKAEPYAYSYAFDDGATMACKGACYYRVTFGTG
ncbi:thaumatin family protein [Actinacidiphila paucisporea]|uniref:Thaumatin family protein n=1 Tax=Actinacidiphila paucisporea TaxID=310782 RepID=A0A1M7G335_9ACTN|nr:thaumatin family protein [Actinacidiphila paucisporea]SHM10802.1 Thaumatin family protein [Actinacidiphila paucisporea]